MRMQSKWRAGAACLVLSAALPVCVTAAGGRSDSPAEVAPLSLANGVSVTNRCDTAPSASVEHVSFSPRATHRFLGYGVNMMAGEGVDDAARTVAELRKLGFSWVRTSFPGTAGTPPEAGGDESEQPADMPESVAASPALNGRESAFLAALHAAGIKVVAWGTHDADAYFEEKGGQRNRKGQPKRVIRPDAIADLARAAADSYREQIREGLKADYLEPFNEPNLGNHKFHPEEYAVFVKDLESDLGGALAEIHIAAPGTAARVEQGMKFVDAMREAGALSGLGAITLHTYYFRDHPTNAGVPSADDPDFQSLAQTARTLNVPFIGTEFGGADIRNKEAAAGSYINAAEEMKAALDLVRQGESAAIVWRLYAGASRAAHGWAIIGPQGPTNGYWVFANLRRIPVGSDVLAVDHSDVSPTMVSLGYAAFRSGPRLYVGLSNPAPEAATVSLDLSRLGNYAAVHALGFLHDRTDEHDGSIRPKTCPVTVTIPSGTGAVIDFAQM